MSADVEFKITGKETLQAALNKVTGNIADASPAMRGVSMVLLKESERIFAREGKGVGLDEPWAPLSEVTKLRREQTQGGRTMKILQASGKLAASLTPTSTAHSAGLTTNRVYAATMFFGAKQGEFGRDRRNHPVPWGDIPGRVFLPVRDVRGTPRLTEPAERSVTAMLARHFAP